MDFIQIKPKFVYQTTTNILCYKHICFNNIFVETLGREIGFQSNTHTTYTTLFHIKL